MIRFVLRFCFWSALALVVGGAFSFYHIRAESADYISNDGMALPACKAGLVLGTSPRLGGGSANLYFSHRMQAAARLYQGGRVKYLILSGDNRRADYNEPREMRRTLLALGVPDSALVADFAGLRTFDSMVRCREVFGQDSVIVISQAFHNERAVFIGRHIGIAAYGYNAAPVSSQQALRIAFREFFSRIKCMLDLYLLHTQAKHLGEKIKLP